MAIIALLYVITSCEHPGNVDKTTALIRHALAVEELACEKNFPD
jgi:hypothetical protein